MVTTNIVTHLLEVWRSYVPGVLQDCPTFMVLFRSTTGGFWLPIYPSNERSDLIFEKLIIRSSLSFFVDLNLKNGETLSMYGDPASFSRFCF